MTEDSATAEFNAGERVYVGETSASSVVREHVIRYEFAAGLVASATTVVDAACGSGYGSQMLGGRGSHVVGIDISDRAINYALQHHKATRVSYVRADLDEGLPVSNAGADLIVSFETIEHVSNPGRLVSEFARVLRPGGQLVVSSPDRRVYSDLTGYVNPFHRSELSRQDLIDTVSMHLEVVAMYGQARWTGPIWRSRIKGAIKRRLPAGMLRRVRDVRAWPGRQASVDSSIENDLSLHAIEPDDPNLYYFHVVVARKP